MKNFPRIRQRLKRKRRKGTSTKFCGTRLIVLDLNTGQKIKNIFEIADVREPILGINLVEDR